MRKVKYPIFLLFALFSCVDEFQPQQKRHQPTINPASKSTNCIYWYLVTNEKTSNTTNTSQKFVYSSCADYNSPSGIAQGNTEDYTNLTSAGGISFPKDPAPNDNYEYTGPEGDYVRYNFTIDRSWRVVERIIPMLVIQEYPDRYMFLNDPNIFDGKVIFGQDDLYYTYDGGLDRWHGEAGK